MTSKLTREKRINEVKELIANAEKWAGFYEHPIHDKPQREMFEGMAKVMSEHLAALAATDSEPAGEFYEDGPLNWYQISDGDRVPAHRRIPLYRHAQPASELKPVGYLFVSGQGAIAYSPTDWGMPGFKLAGQIFGDIDVESQPAPVVQENSDPRDAFEAVFPMPKHAQRCGDGYAVTSYGAWTAYEFVKKWEGWNACRAAMFQAGTLTNEDTKQAWTGIPDIDNAINMLDRIDTLESCDDDRIEAVKTVLRRLAGNSPVIPDGYVMVPKEPTERMVIAGFESEPEEGFSELQVWEAYEDMSGCEQAACRARLCWAAMLAAAPQEVKGEHRIRDEMDMGARITSHRFKV
ncbi:TPA: hypothetical protein ACWYGP_003447 [Raoultella planticola]